jgi:hypothetical protein
MEAKKWFLKDRVAGFKRIPGAPARWLRNSACADDIAPKRDTLG